MNIQVNKQIIVKVIEISGGPITTYEWRLDNIIKTTQTDTFIIQPYSLSMGIHDIKFKGTNYCGNSIELTENINIIEVNQMQQTDPITVNQPAMTPTVTLRRKSDITVTVLDDPNSATPNAPVQGAVVDIAGKQGTTGADGKATMAQVPYGSQNIITTYT